MDERQLSRPSNRRSRTDNRGSTDHLEKGRVERELVSVSARIRQFVPPVPVLIAGISLVAVLFLFVFPTRTYWSKRSEQGDANHQVEFLQGENKQMKQQIKKLSDEAEIERIARERFNLVKPGEDAYAIVPGPTTTTTP